MSDEDDGDEARRADIESDREQFLSPSPEWEDRPEKSGPPTLAQSDNLKSSSGHHDNESWYYADVAKHVPPMVATYDDDKAAKNAEIIARYAREQLDEDQEQARANAKTAMLTYGLVGVTILGLATYTYNGVRDVISSSITMTLLLVISFLVGLGTILFGQVKYKQILRSFRIYRNRKEAQLRLEYELSHQAEARGGPDDVKWSAGDG